MAVERIGDAHGIESGADAADSLFAVPTVSAFIGRTRRGPLNEPVTIASLEEFRRAFGDPCAFSHLPGAVADYFAHGGQRAVIVRIANGATRARIDVPAGEETLRLQAREPGSDALLRVSIDYDGLGDDVTRFNLVAQRLASGTARVVEDQELFPGLSIEETSERFLVDVLKSSRLLRVGGPLPRQRPAATLPPRPGEAIPYWYAVAPGQDGAEITDYDVIGSADEGTGLFALERVANVDLLCIPAPPERDLGHTSFVAAVRYCERRRAMLVWDPPAAWHSTPDVLEGLRHSALASANALTYFPRLTLRIGAERQRGGLPACGAIAGLLARRDRERNHVGEALLLRRGLSPTVELRHREAALLERYGVNAFERAGRGHFAFRAEVSMVGAHGLGRVWQNLERRRLALFVVTRIEQLMAAAGDCSDAAAWSALQRRIKRFLVMLYASGVLVGATSEQAFFTRPERGGFARSTRFRFGFAPETAGEFVAFEIARNGAPLKLAPSALREALELTA